MDLKSGRIYWPIADGTIATYAPLERDVKCEVAVIGGGISGALTAHYLAEAGVEVVVIDKREIAHGSTAATTGLLQYEIDASLCELTSRFGEAAAARCYQLCIEANREFQSLPAELRDPCA